MNHSFVKMLKGFVILAFITGVMTGCVNDHDLMVKNLKVEYLENPLGMDKAQPRFSWEILAGQRGMMQSGYRIFVSDNPETIRTGDGNIWDSGNIDADQAVNIVYNGKPLESDKTYYWNVNIWDQNGEQTTWGEPASFRTGFLNSSDWEAKWIGSADTTIATPLLRKEFEPGKGVKEAYLYITAAGFYEAWLNGKKVGDHVLDPSITDYRKRLLYSTYDVTDQLKNKSNVIGVVLGNGAFHLKKTQGRYCWSNGGINMGNPRILAQINITYHDGTKKSIVSDNSWKFSSGPITFNNLYGGEDYDARLEKEGWTEAGFDDSAWQTVNLEESPSGIVVSQLTPAIKVTETFKSIAKTNPEPGVYLFDLGQNFAGWWKIKVKGSNGLTIRVRGAETLNDSLYPKTLTNEDRLSKKQPYQANIWTDYTLSGKGTETYEPKFFYTGFRYVEVTTDKPEELKSIDVEGRVVRSALADNGYFHTSDSLINKIHRASIWAQKSNTQGYPTDCPQREKGGYTGDGQVIAEASIHDFQMAAFYTKWMNDMKDAQEPNGRIPNTAPTLVGGSGGGIAWGSAYVLLPWWMYNYYNDTRIMQEHYPTMKQYLNYLRNLAKTDSNPEEPYLINNFGTYWFSLGEWCAPGQRDCPNHPMVNSFYYYFNSHLMSKIAAVIGEKEDAAAYAALADTIKNAMNKKFFNSETYLYGTDTTYQTYQLIALTGGLVPEGQNDKVFETITKDIQVTHNGHLNTGIIGTKYLWPALVLNGKSDIAHSLVTQTTYPSFGYWITKGATTLRENWIGRASQNHQMFGSVDEYFFKFLAGIQAPTDGKSSVGYKHIHIQPYIPEGLATAKGSVNTVAGTIESDWRQSKDGLQLNVLIPANSDATISIPLLKFSNPVIREGNKIVWQNGQYVSGIEGITNGVSEEGFITFTTGSGDYKFNLSEK